MIFFSFGLFSYFIFDSFCFSLPIDNEKTVPGWRFPENIFYLPDFVHELTTGAFVVKARRPPARPLPSMYRSNALNEAINPDRTVLPPSPQCFPPERNALSIPSLLQRDAGRAGSPDTRNCG